MECFGFNKKPFEDTRWLEVIYFSNWILDWNQNAFMTVFYFFKIQNLDEEEEEEES